MNNKRSPFQLMSVLKSKRPLDDEYSALHKRLSPVDLKAVPQNKALKKVHGPIRPNANTDDHYLTNLENNQGLSRREKINYYRQYMMHKANSAPPITHNTTNKRIRFGTKQTVRIPKKRPEYKHELRQLKQHNRQLKHNIFPNLADERDDDRTLTNLLLTEVPADIEEETEAIVYSPTIEEEPIPEIQPLYTLHFYLMNAPGNYMRAEPFEQTIQSTSDFEDVILIGDDLAEDNGFEDVDVYVGIMDENQRFTPFPMTYNRLSKKLHTINDLLPNGVLDIVIDVSAKHGGKNKRFRKRSIHKKRYRRKKGSKKHKHG